jgi:hypothetical protein
MHRASDSFIAKTKKKKLGVKRIRKWVIIRGRNQNRKTESPAANASMPGEGGGRDEGVDPASAMGGPSPPAARLPSRSIR